MRRPYVSLHYHFVWSTWDRCPRITPASESRLHAAIAARCTSMGAVPLAVGGVEDHVHLLVSSPSSLAPADLIKDVKGATSHLANHEFGLDEFFRWQGAYGVFAVSSDRVATVKRYVLDQRVHHSEGSLVADWEQTRCERWMRGREE